MWNSHEIAIHTLTLVLSPPTFEMWKSTPSKSAIVISMDSGLCLKRGKHYIVLLVDKKINLNTGLLHSTKRLLLTLSICL